jgi:rSAM/selenodomain-associated transferase 1
LGTVAVAIVCKTPAPGQSKTRLSPPLRPEECAAISACFIRDLSATIEELVNDGDSTGHAVYTPRGSERALRALLPGHFELTPQCDGGFGERLLQGAKDLLDAGHDGAILINSDSPTLPASILRAAVEAVRQGDNVVLSPAFDGGYTLIGLSKLHSRLFEDIPWSTSSVYRLTLDRAREIGLPVVNLPGWYDVDDAASLRMLETELSGGKLPFAAPSGSPAPATRRFLRERRSAFAVPA